MTDVEYAIRRVDGEPIHDDYSWIGTGSVGDDGSTEKAFDAVEGDWDDEDEPVEYELCRLTFEVVERRTLGGQPACDSWAGTVERREWVALMLRSDGTGERWPVKDVSLHHYDSVAEARAAIDALPETLQLLAFGRLGSWSRSELYTLPSGFDVHSDLHRRARGDP